LIIEAEKGGADKVNVVVSDLDNGTTTIPGSASGSENPYYYNDRYLELFTEHYLNITQRTPPFWGLSETALPSAYYTGWVPDWTHSNPGPGRNIFTNPLTYDNFLNGDGTFLYPGEDVLYPGENSHLAGPLSSIRAKNWRRGAQDYEYLWLAKKAGLDDEIKIIIDNCVPSALWDAKTLNNISWSSRGYIFEKFRKQLAELLSTNTKSH